MNSRLLSVGASCSGSDISEKYSVRLCDWSRNERGLSAFGLPVVPTSCVIREGVKRPQREVNLSPPCSAEVKKEGPYTSASPVCLHGVDRAKFTFLTFY